MGFWPTWNRYNAATKRRISHSENQWLLRKCIFNDVCTEIIFGRCNDRKRFRTFLTNIMQITMKLEACT